ncbi:MAG TPA: hypothetical protein PK156_30320, partial [Polyangium sp.]|nr:hypothetical protein [Polyangium sp.]
IVDAINTANPLMGVVNLGFAVREGDWYTVGLESVGVAVTIAAVIVGKKLGVGSVKGNSARNLHLEAVAERDRLAADLSRTRHPPATVVGAYSPSLERVTAGASKGGGLGCAEGACANALGNPGDIQFTEAVRPRTGDIVPVCKNCESTYGRGAFPDPATRFRSDMER